MLHPTDTYHLALAEHAQRVAAADRERLARGLSRRARRTPGPPRTRLGAVPWFVPWFGRRPRPATSAQVG